MGILAGKVALITGAASGIGHAAALTFAAEGARLVLADVDEQAGELTAKEVVDAGGQAVFMGADISRRADVQALVARALSQYGALTAAFNNAGISGPLHPLVGYPDADFERVLSVNLRGTWYCLQEQIPAMIEAGGGSIVNNSSAGGVAASPDIAAYIASKHAIMGLTKSAAIENATKGVRVNAVLPGPIDTPMPAALTAGTPGALDTFKAAIPAGRMGEPSEVAEAAAWLCSDRASYITGHGLAVDGGYLSV